MALSPNARDALEHLALHHVGEHADGKHDVQRGRMLHAPSLTVNGKGFVFATRNVLVMKLPRLRIDILQGEGIGKRMTMGKREMKEWIALPVDDHAADPTLFAKLCDEALAFVASL